MDMKNSGGPAFPSGIVRKERQRPNDPGSDFYTAGYSEPRNPGMTLRQYAAIKLRVPQSGDGWLDDMIREARRLDADHDQRGAVVAALRRAAEAMSAFTDPEGNMPAKTGEFVDLKAALAEANAVLPASLLAAGSAAAQPEQPAQDTDPDPGPKPGDLLAWGSQAVLDVAAERRRQIEFEGRMPEHDDEYRAGELELAAACYAANSAGYDWADGWPHGVWPWSRESWRPSTPRRDLIKAGALILAAVERRDRAAAARPDDASPDADGWIEWGGGECPVAGDTLVEVVLRYGESVTDRASAFRWWHVGLAYDLVRYRVVECGAE